MKKLRLKALSLGAREILSREQLKSITGGCIVDTDCPGGYCNAIDSTCHYDSGGSGSTGTCDSSTFWCAASQHCVMFSGEC